MRIVVYFFKCLALGFKMARLLHGKSVSKYTTWPLVALSATLNSTSLALAVVWKYEFTQFSGSQYDTTKMVNWTGDWVHMYVLLCPRP